jgi:hypothetical protein
MRPILAKLFKKDRVIIRKTDDELTRMAKYKLRDKQLSRYLQKEKEQKMILDSKTPEIKKLIHMYRLNGGINVSDKYGRIVTNKNEMLLMNSQFLHKKGNYSTRLLYSKPIYRKEWDYAPSNWKRFKILFAFLSSVAFGYIYAFLVSDSENLDQYIEYLITEEQIFAHLTGRADPKYAELG